MKKLPKHCLLCARGFPLHGENHTPTQALGMIPVTRCALADAALPHRGPTLSSPGIEGCGESIVHRGELYFYRLGHSIPRDGRVVLVKREWNYNHGTRAQDREFIALGWNRDAGVFEVLDRSAQAGELRPLTRLKLKDARDTAKSKQWRKVDEPKIVLTADML